MCETIGKEIVCPEECAAAIRAIPTGDAVSVSREQLRRLLALIREQATLEHNRPGGNFGIAVEKDVYARAWQTLEAEREPLEKAMLSASPAQSASHGFVSREDDPLRCAICHMHEQHSSFAASHY